MWTKTFYGNTILDWIIAAGIILAFVVAGRIVYWFFKNHIKKLTAKTKTKLDDILIDMIEEPLTLILVVAGVWFALKSLTLPDNIAVWVENGYYFLTVILVAWIITRLFDSLVKEYIMPLADKTESKLDDQIIPIISKGIKITIWGVAIIIALDNAGYNVGGILAGLGIGGLAFAMAAKDTVANLFGGFTVFADKPFTIGDRINVKGVDGTVKEVGIRSTRIQTLAGRTITIPNSHFQNNPIENLSSEPSRKIAVDIGLTYDMTADQIEEAMATLKAITAANENLEEKVVVAFTAFGDFAQNVSLIYYIKKGADIMGTQTAVNLAISRQFAEKGLDMAFPTSVVYTQAL